MPSDKQLYDEWQAKYPKFNQRQAAAKLALDHALDPDSVTGRLSRFVSKAEPRLTGTIKELAHKTDKVDPSVLAQDLILAEDALTWKHFVLHGAAVFASDVHFPYARWDALELMFRILEDIKVALFTTGNDLNDNTAFGRWDDSRPLGGRSWTNDLAYARKVEAEYYTIIKQVTHNAELADVQGNHDNWFFNHLREKAPNVAEAMIADYMTWKRSHGVLQFSKGYTENALHLPNSNVTFWHGQFAGNKAEANAKNTMQTFATGGQVRNVVVGHTHRPVLVEGYRVGYPDRWFINSPCLSRIENVPYMKRNPNGWGLGFVIVEGNKATKIDFTEQYGYLHAEFKGRDYSVKVDHSTPKEY